MIIAVTTAPREKSNIKESLKSLRKQYKGKIKIYAEPGSYLPTGYSGIEYEETQGMFLNRDFAIRDLINTGEEYIGILQDDFLYADTLKEQLKHIQKDKDFGFYCVYTSKILKDKGLLTKEGRNDIRTGRDLSWGAMYIFHRPTAINLIGHQFYRDHKEGVLTAKKENRQIDAVVGETMKQMGKKCYYHNPSQALHVGETSTRGQHDSYLGLGYTYQSC